MKHYLEQLVLDNISTADATAVLVWKTAPYSLDLEELKSIAYLALVSAAGRWEDYCEENAYSHERVEYFSAYAIKRMRGAIYDHFRSVDWASRALRSKDKMLKEAGVNKGATEEEMMERTGLSQKQVRSTITRMANKPVPLEEAMAGDYEPRTEKPTEVVVESNLILTAFTDAVMALPEDQQTVLILKYFEGIDLKEISRRMGIPSVDVSQLHTDSVMAVYDVLVQYLDAQATA